MAKGSGGTRSSGPSGGGSSATAKSGLEMKLASKSTTLTPTPTKVETPKLTTKAKPKATPAKPQKQPKAQKPLGPASTTKQFYKQAKAVDGQLEYSYGSARYTLSNYGGKTHVSVTYNGKFGPETYHHSSKT